MKMLKNSFSRMFDVVTLPLIVIIRNIANYLLDINPITEF